MKLKTSKEFSLRKYSVYIKNDEELSILVFILARSFLTKNIQNIPIF